MGLFDGLKKTKELNKQSNWKQGTLPTAIHFNEDHMVLETVTSNSIIFYRDIISVEQVALNVEIRTASKTFRLTSKKIRGGKDLAKDLQLDILRRVSENK